MSNVVARDKLKWLIKCGADTATIGKANAVGKDSASSCFRNEAIYAVAESRGRYVGNSALLLVGAFKALAALDGIK